VVHSPDGSRQAAGAPLSRSADEADLRRPLPPGSRAEQVRAWISWFGLGRLIGSAIAMVVVCAGAYWLVRTPPPPTEALLPRVATTSTAPAIAPVASPPVTEVPPAVAVVHVAGAVAVPGVYRVDSGGRVDDAIRLAGVAIDAMKNRPEPHDTLGWAYYKQGMSGRAISSFERALAIAPENATYHYHLGLAYLKIGDANRGRASLTRALELKPDPQTSTDARRVLAESAENR